MKIALMGHGKMGKLIERLAEEQGHEISLIATSKCPATSEMLACADVCIDFSHPDSVVSNISLAATQGINIVVGTTGWHNHLDAIEKIIDKHPIGLLHAPNFSLGIALFTKIVEHAASLIAPTHRYGLAGIELHHKHKIDSPSGTAIALADKINSRLPKNVPPLAFTSVRTGSVPGTHTVIFDSPADTITLTHEARNREGFALGALHAAEWLQGKTGIFTIDDLIRTYL